MGSDSVVQWTYARCDPTKYSVLVQGDSLQCRPCPLGADCTGRTTTLVSVDPTSPISDVVQLRDVVAQQGYWASDRSDGLKYYKCPIAEACELGRNGSRAVCALGYTGLACSICTWTTTLTPLSFCTCLA